MSAKSVDEDGRAELVTLKHVLLKVYGIVTR